MKLCEVRGGVYKEAEGKLSEDEDSEELSDAIVVLISFRWRLCVGKVGMVI